MKRISIDDKLYEAIELFCNENCLNPREYINSLLEKEFTIEKYGEAPPFFTKKKETVVTPVSIPVTEIVPVQAMEEPEGLKELKKEEKVEEVKPSESQKKKEARRRIQNL